MRIAMLVGLSALLLGMHGGAAFAGDGPTPEGRPPTAAEVVEKFLSTDPAVRATGEKAVAEAPPAFLREVLAAIRERVEQRDRSQGPLRIPAPTAGEPATEPPDLPDPVFVPGKTRLVNLEVRFIYATRDAARALFGCDAGAGRHTVRQPSSDEVACILDGIEKEGGGLEKLTATRLTVYDGQRATVQVLNKVSYIADYGVELGKDAFIADPIVKTVAEGLVLDLRPTLSADGKSIRLEFASRDSRVARPIEEEEVGLLPQGKPVKIQRPEVTTAGWSKTFSVRDGGSALVGGWSSADADGKEHVHLILLDAKSLDASEIEAMEPKPGPDIKAPEEPKPDPTQPPR